MQRPAVEIFSKPLIALTDSLLRDLGRLFATEGRCYIYIANGHGAWEAALSNVLSRGDKVLVLESGKFGLDWGEAAAGLGLQVEVFKGDWHRAVRPAEVERRLCQDRAGTIKAILALQIDTSTGVVNDIAAIGHAVKAAQHDALLMVDTVASLGCMPFAMDAWGIDVAMAGSQKGLMTPPGLGFVAAGERARAAHRKAGLRTPYWDWTARDGDSHYQKYAGTPPEHLMFALRQALDMLFEEQLVNVFLRHRLLAEAVRRAVAVWKKGSVIDFNVVDPPRAFRYGDHTAGRRLQPQRPARVLRQQMRRGPWPWARAAERQGVSHRAYGPRQRTHGARHAWRRRDRAWRARYRALPRRRSSRDRVAER